MSHARAPVAICKGHVKVFVNDASYLSDAIKALNDVDVKPTVGVLATQADLIMNACASRHKDKRIRSLRDVIYHCRSTLSAHQLKFLRSFNEVYSFVRHLSNEGIESETAGIIARLGDQSNDGTIGEASTTAKPSGAGDKKTCSNAKASEEGHKETNGNAKTSEENYEDTSGNATPSEAGHEETSSNAKTSEEGDEKTCSNAKAGEQGDEDTSGDAKAHEAGYEETCRNTRASKDGYEETSGYVKINGAGYKDKGGSAKASEAGDEPRNMGVKELAEALLKSFDANIKSWTEEAVKLAKSKQKACVVREIRDHIQRFQQCRYELRCLIDGDIMTLEEVTKIGMKSGGINCSYEEFAQQCRVPAKTMVQAG
eukprot:TRINITY_DN14423_c0_g1_i1.p1 TRINITY_DN14423_c0_g1~~TRINITY_DN14423_c0_g1_i1.p1  ORF type:complete len:370 (+),score=117.14 TRINITY_DN14423_c0_g1_i1:502-1611(+)